MRLMQLYYFKILAEKEHLLKTAESLFVSAPALSASISKLESELGVELFDRVGRNIKLNENGKILYNHVSNVFRELDDAKEDLSGRHHPDKEIINIGVSAPSLWAEAICAFLRLHPDVSINHTTLRLDQLRNPTVNEKFNLIITDIRDIDDTSWEHRVIIEDNPVLMVWDGHPLQERKEISLIETRKEPYVALTRGYSSRRFFDQTCEMAGFIPNIVAEGDYALRTQLVDDRYGISFSSVLGSKSPVVHGLKFIEITEPSNPRIQTIFWRKDEQLSENVCLFRDFIIEFYRDYPE